MGLTLWAVGVLKAEAGLVSLCHSGPVEGQQVIVCEHLDAVVMPGNIENSLQKSLRVCVRVCVCVCVCVPVNTSEY